MSYSNVYNRFKRLVYYFLNIDKYNLPIKLHIKKVDRIFQLDVRI